MELKRVEIIEIHDVKIWKSATYWVFVNVDMTINVNGNIERVEMTFDLTEWQDIKEQMAFMRRVVD